MNLDNPTYCACGCGQYGHHWHHALIHRMKRFSKYLDDPRNMVFVNAEEHISRKFDNQEWRAKFWKRQCLRYGKDKMMEWVNGLPEKLRHRLDFVN